MGLQVHAKFEHDLPNRFRDMAMRLFSTSPHSARATCYRGHSDGSPLVKFVMGGMRLSSKEDRMSFGPRVSEI